MFTNEPETPARTDELLDTSALRGLTGALVRSFLARRVRRLRRATLPVAVATPTAAAAPDAAPGAPSASAVPTQVADPVAGAQPAASGTQPAAVPVATPGGAAHETASPAVDPAAQRLSLGTFAGVVGIVCNVLLCLGKGVVGLLAGSVSIVADAVNNLSDAASNIVSMLGFRLASRPADAGHPYGHGRFEYLAGLTVAVLVCAVGIELVKSSIEKIARGGDTEFNGVVALILVASVAVKLWMMVFNRAVGRAIDSQTLVATAVDSRNDVIATAAVLVCAVISQLTGFDLDGWAGVAVGAFILVSGVGLVRDAVNPLLGSAPDPALVEHIRERILSYPGVLGTHDLMVHDYGPGRRFASAHVEMPAEGGVLASHDLLDRIEQDFKERDNLIMTLHMDPVVTSGASVDDLRGQIARCAAEIDPRVTIHDVRAVSCGTYVSVDFDCVKPDGVPLGDDELRARLTDAIRRLHPRAVCEITIDHGYVSAQQ